MVEFPTAPFRDGGDVPETAIHHLPLQDKESSYCIIELFCLLCWYLEVL